LAGAGGDGDAEDDVREHIDIGLVDVAIAVDIGVTAELRVEMSRAVDVVDQADEVKDGDLAVAVEIAQPFWQRKRGMDAKKTAEDN